MKAAFKCNRKVISLNTIIQVIFTVMLQEVDEAENH